MSFTEWIDKQISQLDFARTSPNVTVKIRPWSTVLRVPTTAGVLYAKALPQEHNHEVALTVALSDWLGDHSIHMLASEPAMGWMLMSDCGNTLRQHFTDYPDPNIWKPILSHYAKSQIELIDHVTHLGDLGIPNRQPSKLPDFLHKVLANEDVLYLGREECLSYSQLAQLHAFMPAFTSLCAELAATPIPLSVNHGDLHDGNIFYNNGHHVFFDWGDASIAHPFFSLRTTYVSLENRFDIPENDPSLNRFRDVYLEPWTDIVSRSECLEIFELSQRLWSLSSLAGWYQALGSISAEEREPYYYAVSALLIELLEANADLLN